MQRSPAPLVSIGMPVRNNAATIRLAIQSIIQQSFEDWELIVIDDGSTDGTGELVKSFNDRRVKLRIFGDSLGLAARLNQAIDWGAGEYFARMDGDDVSFPTRLEAQLQFLGRHPEIDLVGTSMMVLDREGNAVGKRVYPTDHASITANPISGFPMAHPTFFGKSSFFKQYRYNAELKRAQDQDLLFRAHAEAQFANVSTVLFGWREASLSLRKQYEARVYRARTLASQLRDQKRPHLAAAAVAEQAAKLAVDAIAISTGLGYRLLPHRAKPITEEECLNWNRIRNDLLHSFNESVASARHEQVLSCHEGTGPG